MKKQSFFWCRLFAVLLDGSAIYCLSSIFQVVLYNFFFISFLYLFIVTFIVYYSLSYFLMKGRTPGKLFSRIRIKDNNHEKLSFFSILTREVIAKGIIGICTPLYLFLFIPSKVIYPFVFPRMMLIILISAILLIIFKRTWWEWLSGTTTVKDKKVTNPDLTFGLSFFAGVYILFIVISVAPFLSNRNDFSRKWPLSYPPTGEVKQYAGFIRNHHQDPVDYLFDLFEKYDIVVLSENMHPEYSQYELFFKIFRDPRFTSEIGNIFTEIGSVSYQDSLNNYLITKFNNEDEFNRGTSRLQRNFNAVWPVWDNTNMFDMFKTIHSLNDSLADSLRINWFFTDLPVDWKTATHETFIKNDQNPDRDSLMAVQVIDKYSKILTRQRRHKAIVIMNTYHGYGLQPDGKNYFGGTAAYIMKELPGKVATVMMNTISQKYLWVWTPVANGKWDAAFELAGNHASGFNFEGSPFGEDDFDARAKSVKNIKYKDVFTGFIFYTPLYSQICKNGFPYEFDNAEVLIKRGLCVSKEYSDLIKHISTQKADINGVYDIKPPNYPIIYNLINAVALPFMMGLFLIVVIIGFFIIRRRLGKEPLIS